jgi:hypothetical protein
LRTLLILFADEVYYNTMFPLYYISSNSETEPNKK